MKNVIVGGIQTRATSDLDDNLKRAVFLVKQAAKRGAQIICLPELFRTPYFPQSQGLLKAKFAETIPGETTRTMSSLAKKLGAVIIVPLYEMTPKKQFFNTAVVFDDKGKMLGKYRKIHIPHDPGFYEKDYFTAGNNGYKIFKTKFATFAVLICYDQWYPEAARAARLAGAEIIFYPTAIANLSSHVSPEGNWHDAWETVMRGHAIANSLAVMAVNRVGRENKNQFWGQSFVCDAFGKVVKIASRTREQVLIAKIDLALNKFIADGWGFLRNRRPDTYKSLTTNKLILKSKHL